MNELIEIDQMHASDWEDVRIIYLEGIKTGNATFQQVAPSWEEWDKSHLSQCRLVARSQGKVIGWAALSPTSSRCVYAGVAEVSIYVSPQHQGSGVGSRLINIFIEASEQHGFWTLQSGVFPENKASLELHRKFGFREVGRRERIGQMNGIWRDVLLLERRSKVVGIN
jgi:phosphinothricin acetyltransferase